MHCINVALTVKCKIIFYTFDFLSTGNLRRKGELLMVKQWIIIVHSFCTERKGVEGGNCFSQLYGIA